MDLIQDPTLLGTPEGLLRTAPSACSCKSADSGQPSGERERPSAAGSAARLRNWLLWGPPVLVLGSLIYLGLEPMARHFVAGVLRLSMASKLGDAVAFFLYDAPKVLLLLAAATFLVTFLQSFLDPEATRRRLAGRGGAWGSLLASFFGIATPFCSCSAVPLFIGFVRVGVPLGVTFSYLVAAPMINEVALVLLLALFGWKIAAIYAGTGVTIAFVSGWLLGKFRMEKHLEAWVLEASAEARQEGPRDRRLVERLDLALQGAKGIVRKTWPYVLLGIGVGAAIHGYVPEALLARIMGKGAWWTVPLVVLLGVPIYASTAMILPIVQTLLAKGAALGTVLAFMMAATALSLPETILLRRVLKTRLILVFLGVVTTGILAIGYVFNLVL